MEVRLSYIGTKRPDRLSTMRDACMYVCMCVYYMMVVCVFILLIRGIYGILVLIQDYGGDVSRFAIGLLLFAWWAILAFAGGLD